MFQRQAAKNSTSLVITKARDNCYVLKVGKKLETVGEV